MPKLRKKSIKKIKLSFAPKQVTKHLLQALPERARDIITRRYGLGTKSERMTLEAIGQIYGITRERVRQIENYALSTIHKSEHYEGEQKTFDELEGLIQKLGVIVPETEFLKSISSDKSAQNHVHFLLVLGHTFTYEKETDHFRKRWHVDDEIASQVEDALHQLYSRLSDEELLSESEVIGSFLEHLKDLSSRYRDEEVLRRWLSLSKSIGSNPLGEWGRSSSPNINLRGIRDYSYLVIREHGSPMHFTEVAKQIKKIFDREAHVATAHNELIKDPRFVLVGRGLYALSEWGYMEGVVRDVIREILKKHGPLTKDDIVNKVLKERYVKSNTVAVNLQNSKTFKKVGDGKYSLV